METNGINDCIQSEAFPKSRRYKTFNEMSSDVTNVNEVIVLGIFLDKQQTTHIQDQFFKAANSLGDSLNFRHLYIDSVPNVYDLKLIKNLKNYSLPYIILIRPKHMWNELETKFVVHSFGDISDFIKFNYYGLVGLRTGTAFDYFEFPMINIYSDIDYENELKNTIDLRNKILELSQNHKNVKFIISDANKFSDELNKYYGIQSAELLDSLPIVTAQDINHKRFLMNEKPFSIENLSKFVLNLKQQKLEPKFKSENHLSTGLVKELSAQEFEELVFNTKNECFIMFFTKDCDYCKHLEKTLEKLGKVLENEANVVIVRQEFIAGYFAEQFKAEKFPTFYWIDRNNQKVLYYGRHEFNDFLEFIAENSSEELKEYDRLGRFKRVKYEL